MSNVGQYYQIPVDISWLPNHLSKSFTFKSKCRYDLHEGVTEVFLGPARITVGNNVRRGKAMLIQESLAPVPCWPTLLCTIRKQKFELKYYSWKQHKTRKHTEKAANLIAHGYNVYTYTKTHTVRLKNSIKWCEMYCGLTCTWVSVARYSSAQVLASEARSAMPGPLMGPDRDRILSISRISCSFSVRMSSCSSYSVLHQVKGTIITSFTLPQCRRNHIFA